MNESNGHLGFVPLMPDGSPCPTVMLEADLIRFLRLEELGVKNPTQTLMYYREEQKLKPTRIGGRNAYTIQAALEFLEEMTQKKLKRPLDSVHFGAYISGMKDLREEILKKMKRDGLTINQVTNLPKVKGKIPRRTVYAFLSGEKDSASETVSILLDAVGLTITTKGPKRPGKEQKK